VTVRLHDRRQVHLCDACARAVRAESERFLWRVEPAEFVYTCPHGGIGLGDFIAREPARGWKWWAHRIIKRTGKQVWVESSRIPAEDVNTSREDRSGWGQGRLVLDRRTLESQGWAFHSRLKDTAIYVRPHGERVLSPSEVREAERLRDSREQWSSIRERREHSPRDDAALLGISWPAETDDVKAAYRRLAQEHHPDHGGDVRRFMEIQRAYKRLSPDF
jgi:hypothetical protein